MVPPPSNDRHCLVSLATKGVAPLLFEEEASPNVPRQMHRNAAAANTEEECVSLSVKGRGWVYIEPVVGCLQIFWRATTHTRTLPYLSRQLLTTAHLAKQPVSL